MNARVNPGTGSRRNQRVIFNVGFDAHTAARLKAIAQEHRSSLAEAVRTVVAWGLPEEGEE